jgi:hypothetical protein
MMVWLYVLLVAVVLAALPLTWWIKREGERAWRRPRVENGVLVVNIVADVQRYIRAMEEAARATERLAAAFRPRSRRARWRAAIVRLLKGIV